MPPHHAVPPGADLHPPVPGPLPLKSQLREVVAVAVVLAVEGKPASGQNWLLETLSLSRGDGGQRKSQMLNPQHHSSSQNTNLAPGLTPMSNGLPSASSSCSSAAAVCTAL